MKRRSKDAPTWVKHPKWGWLVDECPLFERAYESGDGYLNEVTDIGRRPDGTRRWSYSALAAADYGVCNSGNEYCSTWTPLTTAARELLAALKAEQESR